MSPGKNIVSLSAKQGLTSRNSLWCCDRPSRVELVSAAVDTDVQGIGATPAVGDYSSTGLRVPAAATPDQSHRYLFRLCGLEVPAGAGLVIRGIRQAATIRQEYPQLDAQGLPIGTFVFEREVVSPWWRFIDGNISWHVKWQAQVQSVRNVFHANQTPGTSPTTFGTDSALLYSPGPGLGPFGGPYVPLGAGIPPGRDVPWLGALREMRYPWSNTDWTLSVPVRGPGVVVLYASVYQTNPATRLPMPQLTPPAPFTDPVTCGLRPEDQFLMQHPNAIYGRVAGALLVDLFPDCCEMEKDT